MSTPNLTEINAKLDRLLELLQTAPAPRSKKPRADDPRTDYTHDRVVELEKIFWNIVNAPRHKREKSFRYPKCLLEHPRDKPLRHIQALLISVLVNQASLRKVFQRKGMNDPAGESPAECATRLIAQTNLIVAPLYATAFDSNKPTLVVLSPLEARDSLRDESLIPDTWKGWSCTERALPYQPPFEGQRPVPAERCPSDAGAAPKLGRVYEDEDTPAPTRIDVEDYYFDEDEETAPLVKPSSRLDFSSLEDPAPADYYKTRVQFVEEEE